MKYPVAVVILLLAPALLSPVLAEHEADHRYTVRGYVLDDQRQPLAGKKVSIRGFASATTDSAGEYRIRLHLHNADLGKNLQIHSDGVESTIRVSFDPSDTHSARVHYANFVGGEFVSGELSGTGFPAWGFAAAGLGVVMAGGLVLAAKRRGAGRRHRASAKPPPAKRGKAKGKRKKRKR